MAFAGTHTANGSPQITYKVSYSIDSRSNGSVKFKCVVYAEMGNSSTFDYDLQGRFIISSNEATPDADNGDWFYIHDASVDGSTALREENSGETRTKYIEVNEDVSNGLTVVLPQGGTYTAEFETRRPNGDGTAGTLDSNQALGTVSYPSFYLDPNAPTSVAASRYSTSQNRITWVNHPSADRPISSNELQYSTDGSSWVTISTSIGATTTSYLHTCAATTSYLYRVRAKNSEGTSSYVNASSWTAVVPNPPAALVATQNKTSNSNGSITVNSHTITLTTPDRTFPRNWDGWYLERWSSATNTWTQIAAIGATTYTYTDSSLAGDNGYQYRARSYNVAGASGYTNTTTVYTQPLAPVGPQTASKLAYTKMGSTIGLSWNNPSTIESGVEVYKSYSTDGGVIWSSWVLHTTLAANSTSTSITGVNTSQQHKYLVKNVAPGLITSTPLASDPIILITAPIVGPTLLGSFVTPDNFYDINDTPIYLEWQHNPADGTAQRKYEIQIRKSGAAWPTTSPVTGADNSYAFSTAENGFVYEWRVRTWGTALIGGSDGTGASPWSTIGSFKTNTKPTCSITNPPTGVWGWPTPEMTVEHTYADAEGSTQTRHRTELWTDSDPAQLVWQSETAGAQTSVDIDYQLQNTQAYLIKKKVMDGSGVWSDEETRAFAVIYQEPPATPDPAVSLTAVLGTGQVVLTWVAPASASGGDNPWDQIRIERFDTLSGVWTTVENKLPYNLTTTYTDTTIEDNRAYQYRIIPINTESFQIGEGLPIVDLVAYGPARVQDGFVYTEPAAPSSLRASQPYDVVILTWKNNASYDTKLRVERENVDEVGTTWMPVGFIDSSNTSLIDINVSEDTTYTYRIRAEQGALASDWVLVNRNIRTKKGTIATNYSINIPPVRRRGPRESAKENIEAAEFATIRQVISERLSALTEGIESYNESLGSVIDEMYAGVEAARLRKEVR